MATRSVGHEMGTVVVLFVVFVMATHGETLMSSHPTSSPSPKLREEFCSRSLEWDNTSEQLHRLQQLEILENQQRKYRSMDFPSHEPKTCNFLHERRADFRAQLHRSRGGGISGGITVPPYIEEHFPCLACLLPKPHEIIPNTRTVCWYAQPDQVELCNCTSTCSFLFRRPTFGKKRMCLPTVFILGPQRTGTTDLWNRIHSHPEVYGSQHEEIHFWTAKIDPVIASRKGRKLFEHETNAPSYSLFDYSFESCHRFTHQVDPKVVVVEGSASTLWDITLTGALNSPAVMAALLPWARFVGSLRNPVDRLWSDYWHFTKHWAHFVEGPPSPGHFHEACSEKVAALTACFNRYGMETCIFCSEYRSYSQDVCRLELGLYSIYLEKWFEFFPSQSFHIDRLEAAVPPTPTHLSHRDSDLADDRSGPILAKEHRAAMLAGIFRHIGVKTLSREEMGRVVDHNLKNRKSGDVIEMLPETRKLLTEFYQPYNEELARLLGDDRFLWSEWLK
eukprot:TRINITY_DN16767_c0_g1_i1.p1 TRINITY_DN16767_c0_g1~~TRINITY_DN16767_c0_g1_i1.p1  ORF type:complete len:505 (+),score=54.76 TRINITY_DN16767_c0_g1_i1:229-1743(+)